MSRWKHSITKYEFREFAASISEDGKVTIKHHVSGEEYDEITVPASLIFQLAYMLKGSRRLVHDDRQSITSDARMDKD